MLYIFLDTTYILNNCTLNVPDQHTYLGVIIHKSLSWSPHISSIVTKASRTLNFIKRNLRKWSSQVKESEQEFGQMNWSIESWSGRWTKCWTRNWIIESWSERWREIDIAIDIHIYTVTKSWIFVRNGFPYDQTSIRICIWCLGPSPCWGYYGNRKSTLKSSPLGVKWLWQI